MITDKRKGPKNWKNFPISVRNSTNGYGITSYQRSHTLKPYINDLLVVYMSDFLLLTSFLPIYLYTCLSLSTFLPPFLPIDLLFHLLSYLPFFTFISYTCLFTSLLPPFFSSVFPPSLIVSSLS